MRSVKDLGDPHQPGKGWYEYGRDEQPKLAPKRILLKL